MTKVEYSANENIQPITNIPFTCPSFTIREFSDNQNMIK